jgi:hypothetical protein
VTNLSNEEVRRMRMHPAKSLDEALAATASHATGYIMPRGAAFLPLRKPDR